MAKKKTFPALFGLFRDGLLPGDVSFVGYARSEMSNEEFEKKVTQGIKPKPKEENHKETLKDFVSRCSYVQCESYDSEDDMKKLVKHISEKCEKCMKRITSGPFFS